jgi:hypothetical protein
VLNLRRAALAIALTTALTAHSRPPEGGRMRDAAAARSAEMVAAAAAGPAAGPVVAPASVSASAAALGITLAAEATQPATAARMRLAKIIADWSTIEAQRGTFAWSALDAAISTALRDGLSPILVLAHTPKWATIGTGADLARAEIFSRQPPRDIRTWERFVDAVAARYKDRVKEWQVWTQLGLPHFRGTGAEYAALLQSAHRRLRAADIGARVAMTSPSGMDLAFVVRASQELGSSLDAVSLTAAGFGPEALLRPLGIISRRVRAQGKAVWLEWAPDAPGPAAWVRLLAVAHAGGVDRVFASGPSGGDADLRQAAAALGARAYAGYLPRDPDVYAAVFGEGTDALVVAWATAEARALEVAGTGVRAQTVAAPAARVEVRDGRTIVSLTLSPALIAGVPAGLVEEARTSAARGPMIPAVAPDRDFSRATEVSALLGRTGSEERGLYNARFRARRNGAVEVVDVGGQEAVRTAAARDVIYVYFDVDDTFLYFAEGRAPVEVTVEVWGGRAERQVGFNILYDSTNGYRFTPWQWVAAREGWIRYAVRLSDVSMANTWGFDFAINAGGNRGDDLIVRSVTVRKLAN